MAMATVKPSSNVQNVCSSRDYTLDPDKALLKKKTLNAARRQQVEYLTAGGEIEATMDAVSFELFKLPVMTFIPGFYHSHNSKLFNIKNDVSKDNKGNTMYSIHIQSP